jgi:predicted GNAT family acetyltransferase
MEIVHDQESQKFFIKINGKEAYLYYRLRENVMDFASTYVPNELRGKGIAANIVEAGLNYARKNNYLIIPSCSYVAVFMRRNKQYQDLLAHKD